MFDNVGNINITGIKSDSLQKLNLGKNSSSDFKSFLFDAMDKVNETAAQSKSSGYSILTGEADEVHNIMIDSVKSEITLQLAVQLRNKALDAYKEVMNMQL